jgi:hypothetical protein
MSKYRGGTQIDGLSSAISSLFSRNGNLPTFGRAPYAPWDDTLFHPSLLGFVVLSDLHAFSARVLSSASFRVLGSQRTL